MKNTLVLGGGGQFGIAWELGLLYGLNTKDINLRKMDAIIGTSAGSQVGAAIASNWNWDKIWQNQIELTINEENPEPNMHKVFEKYNQISKQAKDGDEWVALLCQYAKTHVTRLDENAHIQQIKNTFQQINWGANLQITGTNIDTYTRKVWKAEDNVDIYKALSASSSLPGVWPPTTINDKLYSDGGSYSMENADLAIEAEKVIILSPHLPVDTPLSLEDQINILKQHNTEVLAITPSSEVLQKLKALGGNTVDPSIRKEIAEASIQQGIAIKDKVKQFIEE